MLQNPKFLKSLYWITTVILCLLYGVSVIVYISDLGAAAETYVQLGYPAYLPSIMIFVKALGVLAVLVRKPVWLAQLAYAGFFYHLILAFVAHIGVGDPGFAPAVLLLVCAIVSWATQNYARTPNAPYAFQPK